MEPTLYVWGAEPGTDLRKRSSAWMIQSGLFATVYALRIPTDQKVGGSNPSERAHPEPASDQRKHQSLTRPGAAGPAPTGVVRGSETVSKTPG
jgi:hypothetical protein